MIGMKVAKKYVVSGRVQGVGYRFFAERVAQELGMGGYVKNLWDGRVEVYAIGDEALLERSEEHTSELQSRLHLVCRLLLEKKKKYNRYVASPTPYMTPTTDY